ncbi:MAG: hypothetical protein AAGD33_10600 [Actinomycetota bacterium]
MIFYRFSFTIGSALHPEELARRLLGKGVAVVAVDGSGEVLVGPTVAAAVEKLESLDASLEQLENPTLGKLLRFGLRHPRTALAMLRSVRTPTAEQSEEQEDVDDDDDRRSIREMADGLRIQFGELAYLEGLASVIDDELLRPNFSVSEPWMRLSLPPVAITHHAASEADILDVSLLIHRSGEAVMVFALLLDADRSSVDVLNGRAGCTVADLVASTMDRELVDLYAAALGGRPGEGEVIEGDGRPQIEFDHPEERVSLGDVFSVYREAVVYAATGKPLAEHLGEYLMTPLLSVRGLADAEHAAVGTSLAMHYNTDSLTTSRARISDRFVAGPFHHSAATVYLSSSCVVSLSTDQFRADLFAGGRQPDGQDWMYPEFALGLAVDLALLRLRMVESFGARLALARTTRDLNDAATRLLASYPEVSGDRLLRVGELSEVEEALLSQHGFEARRDAVLAQHQISQELAVGRESERIERSSARTQGLVVLLTVLVAVLGSVGSLLQPEVESSWMPSVGSTPFDDWGAVVLVAVPALLLVSLTLVFASSLARKIWRRVFKPPPLTRLPTPPLVAAHRLPGKGFRFVRGSEDSD